jgi:protein-tyrosine sulfotransferase
MYLTSKVRKTAVTAYRAAYVARWRKRSYVSDASPIVVGGCPRSGTTLMRVILDTHPNIACGPESGIFVPRWPSLKKLPDRFGMPRNTVMALFKTSPSQAWFIDEFFKLYTVIRDKPRWAEKTPANVNQLEFLFEHFPKARFIHMIRDGRDTVCSLRTHPRHKVVDGQLIKLDTRHPIGPCTERWVHDVSAGRRYRDDPRCLEVRYEELVGDPRATLERVFERIGEPFDDRVLDFHSVKGRSRDFTNFPQNPEATKPLYTAAVSRWHADFSGEDLTTVKRLAGPLLIELGYAADLNW